MTSSEHDARIAEITALLATEWAHDRHVTVGSTTGLPSYSTQAVDLLRCLLAEYDALSDQLAASEARTARLVEAADMLTNTVVLMNSMIRSGEPHSPTSEKVMRESLDAYRALAESPTALDQRSTTT
jgi:hypothetical protein